ncbi:MAG: transposase [Verrucomicrobia bacterium]|nr:transposase [Verrucomicrobiota bacterium]
MPQSLAQVYLHVVFSTKDRIAFLQNADIRPQMHAYLATAFTGHDCRALAIGGVRDHVHALCAWSRTRALAEVIGDVKRVSSKWIKTKGGQFALFQWQGGYGAFSVSHSNVGRVRAYIAGQEAHHRTMTFQDKLRALLRRHGVVFDERYVWD